MKRQRIAQWGMLAWLVFAVQAGAQLQGEYYNGQTLGGYTLAEVYSIVYSHLDGPIDFKVESGNQWYLGTGSNRVHDPDDPGLPGPPDIPTAYVGSTDFCVRWRGQLKVPTAGDYAFYLTAQDGVRLYIDNIADGQSLGPDYWNANGLHTYQYSVTGLPAGRHEFRVDYVNRTATAQIRLEWAGPGIAQQVIPLENLLPPSHGLVAEFYNHSDSAWNFNLFPPPVKTRYDRNVDWWWGYAGDERVEELIQYDYFSVVWKGMLDVTVASNYRFKLDYLDDNGYVKIDGVTRIADDGQMGVVYPGLTRESWPLFPLAAGKHRIEVGMREITGDAGCRLSWWRTGQGAYSVIPSTALYPYLQPTDISLSNAQLPENNGSGVLIGAFSTYPAGADFAYALVTGTGDTDNVLFSITGNELYAASDFDFENPHGPAYSIRVQSTDTESGESITENFTITVTDANDAPTGLTLDNDSIAENAGVNAEVGNLTAIDQDLEQGFFYTLVAGPGDTDNGLFNIQGNTLRASASFDYETRQTCSVRIQVQDNGSPVQTYAQPFVIHVTDVLEQPTGVMLSNSTLNENAGANALVGALSTLGPGSGSYSYALAAGEGDDDNLLFNIDGNQLRANSSFDYETRNTYSVRVRSTDAVPPNYSVEQNFTLSIVNVNEAPFAVELSSAYIYENAGPDAMVGAFVTADPDVTQSHTYTLVPGDGDDDNAAFNILSNILRANASFDYETRQTYQIRVRTTDNGAPPLSFERAFTIYVMDIMEPILGLELSNNRIAENMGPNAEIGEFSTQGQGEGYVYQLAAGEGGEDNALFNISGNLLRANAAFNYETRNEYSVRVKSQDEAHPESTFERAFTIMVRDVNEAPTELTLSNNTLYENTGPNAIVGSLATADPDRGQIHTYSLVEGTGDEDNGAFNINGSLLRINANADYEIQQTYHVLIRTHDSGVPPLTRDQAFVITVLDLAEPGTDIRLSNAFLNENAGANASIGTFATTGGGTAPYSYALIDGLGGEDNGAFHLAGTELLANDSFDFETRNVYSIRVQSQDSGAPAQQFTEVFQIRILDVNESPAGIALSNNTLKENAGTNAVIGTLSTTDPDQGQIHFYSLAPGEGAEHNGLFNVNGALLRASGNLDYETGNRYHVRIQSTDNGGLTCEAAFTIEISDVNEAPSGITLSNHTVAENADPATEVGLLSSLDQDQGQSYLYTFVSGPGSADNAKFNISGQQLRTNAPFDFEFDAIYTVRIQTTDNGVPPLSYAQSFLITIEDLNEAPRAILLSNRFVPVSAGPGTYVGSFSTLDPDRWSNQQHAYELVSGEGGAGNGYFQLVEDKLYAGPAFDAALQPFPIRVRSTDNGINPDNLSIEEKFIIVAGEEDAEFLQVDYVRPLDAAPPNYITTEPSVRFLVSFNKAVTGIETAPALPPGGFDDFTPVMTGNLEGAFVESVSGEGSSFIVTVNTGQFDGDLALEVRHDGGVAAAVGGQTLTAPFIGVPPYMVDKSSLAFSRQPEDASKRAGQSHTFTVEVTGAQGVPHYQWKHEEEPVGEDAPVLTLESLDFDDAGLYLCEAYDDWEMAVSEPARLRVFAAVPAAGLLASAMVAAVIAWLGALFLRKRRTVR